ncbi:NAD(P)-binding protein [Zalerion maritima]|uniref:NAD(P)-binding protein n=1 Tax=Zalerion maritima TaxID=339359 RepID=A0AAD5RTL5_9PEZI|nr:NAD(P)-binding protein [Zalerion maritima]
MSADELKSKLIALTGAASGIGRVTAVHLASLGADLSLADLNAPSLEEVKKEIFSATPSAKVITTALDVRDRSAVESWISNTVSHFGCPITGAANLAGVVGKEINIANIEDVTDEDWDFVVDVNLKGVMNCLRAELKQGVLAEGGSIVNAASVAGLTGFVKNSAYVASKHAVVGLTKAVAKEAGPRGIRVNAIAPGPIETPMLAKSSAARAGTEFPTQTLAMRRIGKPSEVASLLAFLLGDGSTFMTGNIVQVDGGLCC